MTPDDVDTLRATLSPPRSSPQCPYRIAIVQSEQDKHAVLDRLSYQEGLQSRENLRGTERGIYDSMAQYLEGLSYHEKGKGVANEEE
jgi:hypothetical protein